MINAKFDPDNLTGIYRTSSKQGSYLIKMGVGGIQRRFRVQPSLEHALEQWNNAAFYLNNCGRGFCIRFQGPEEMRGKYTSKYGPPPLPTEETQAEVDWAKSTFPELESPMVNVVLAEAFRKAKGKLIVSPAYPTEDEAAFCYNVSVSVLKGLQAELREGMDLTLGRKKEIEQETLAHLRKVLELPADFDFGPMPWLYGEKAPRDLVDILMCVNRCAFRELGCRNSCILSSYALAYLLRRLGYSSKVLRITATVHRSDQPRGVMLGGDWVPGSGRRPKTAEGMWQGHVAVLVNDRWLLDPTLDQANNDNIEVMPVAFEVTTLDPRRPLCLLKVNNCHIRYWVYHTQKGFAKAPDARPSHWMPVAKAALAELKAFNVPASEAGPMRPAGLEQALAV